MSDRVGYWADMEHPYITYKDDYIESEWWSLKKIYEKGLLYLGHKIAPYCPRCGTALSSHEVAQGYKNVKETSAFVLFKVKGEDAYLLAPRPGRCPATWRCASIPMIPTAASRWRANITSWARRWFPPFSAARKYSMTRKCPVST